MPLTRSGGSTLGRDTGDDAVSNLPGEAELALLAGERVVGLTAATFPRTGIETSGGRLVTYGVGEPEGGTVRQLPE